VNIPSARQIIAARALLGISQVELAERTVVSVVTIRRFEAAADRPGTGPSMRITTMVALVEFLEASGIEFRDEADRSGVLKAKKLDI
jgi:predicted transcriptional regulator